MEYEPLSERRPPVAPPTRSSRRLLRWVWPALAALLVGAVTGGAGAAAIHVPRVEALGEYRPSLVTQLYDKNGNVFTTFARQRRVMLKQNEIPQVLQEALLASEDSNFYQHGGIDALGIARAALTDIRSGKVKQGASTITMQLARSLYLSRERTWKRKVEEAFVAVELEKSYTKQQILTLYLNLVNLGHGNYGVEAASRYYFAKPATRLTLPEAAMLVGIIPAPSRYSPYRTPDLMRKQRDRVLRRMLEERYITQADYDRAVAQPNLVVPQQAEQTFAPYFSEEVRKFLEQSYGDTKLYEGGLQVQTTLDPQIQKAAENAIRSGLLKIDHRRGWRGPIEEVKEADIATRQLPTWDQGKPVPGRWYQGLVLESGAKAASVRIGKATYELGPEGIAWTNRKQPGELLKRGSVAWFRFEIPQPKAPGGRKAPKGPPLGPPARRERGAAADAGAGAADGGRRPGAGEPDRRRARHGRRLGLRPQQVQPHHPGAPAGGLVLQAVRLRRRHRGGVDPGRHPARRADVVHRRRRQAQ